MRKTYTFLAVAAMTIGLAAGCSGFKGFCDRGSLFPTRQPQVVPTQTMYTVTSDMCCPSEGVIVSGACDPCGNGTMSNPIFSGPATTL
jgi:hypothetical protein